MGFSTFTIQLVICFSFILSTLAVEQCFFDSSLWCSQYCCKVAYSFREFCCNDCSRSIRNNSCSNIGQILGILVGVGIFLIGGIGALIYLCVTGQICSSCTGRTPSNYFRRSTQPVGFNQTQGITVTVIGNGAETMEPPSMPPSYYEVADPHYNAPETYPWSPKINNGGFTNPGYEGENHGAADTNGDTRDTPAEPNVNTSDGGNAGGTSGGDATVSCDAGGASAGGGD